MKRKIIALALSLTMSLMFVPQMSVNAEAKINYKRLYGRYLKSHPIESDFSSMSEWKGTFIYIDKDSIPELLVDGASAQSSCNLYTIKAGKVKKLETNEGWAGGLQYVKKGGKYWTGGGRQDYYHEVWYRLKNGTAKVRADSTHDAWEKTDYTWNGKKISDSKYFAKQKKMYGKDQYIDPVTKYFSSLGLTKYMR